MESEKPVEPSAHVGWSDQLLKAATILGAFIAAGQTGSQALQGYFQHKIELAKASQDLTLAKEKSDSDLASNFLTLILSKDTPPDRRSMLLDALSTLQTHPLHQWAAVRHDEIERNLAGLQTARDAQLEALQEKSTADGNVDDIQSQIQQLTFEILIHREDTDLTATLQEKRITLVNRLSPAKAAQAQAEKTVAVINTPHTGIAPTQTAGTNLSSFHLPTEDIRTALSLPSDRKLFYEYMPFIESALVEFGLTDKAMTSAIIATAAFETGGFRINLENTSGKESEGRQTLGNTEPGDGERYRGRGLILMTGRANYARYSERLGLGTLLIDSPDDAKDPVIASRILCAYFKDQEPAFASALAQSDFRRVRMLVTGGSNGADAFSKLYEQVRAVLKAAQPVRPPSP